jgi:hypothetical protein
MPRKLFMGYFSEHDIHGLQAVHNKAFEWQPIKQSLYVIYDY